MNDVPRARNVQTKH